MRSQEEESAVRSLRSQQEVASSTSAEDEKARGREGKLGTPLQTLTHKVYPMSCSQLFSARHSIPQHPLIRWADGHGDALE